LLTLTWALAILGGCVGLNSIIKRNQQVARIKHTVEPSHITLTVDTWDLLRSGVVLSVGCTVLSVVANIWQLLLLRDMRRKNQPSSRQPISTRTLPYQWMSLAFLSIWILACEIPVTIFAATRSAKTTAFLGGQQLPASIVAATQAQLGEDPHYWAQHYVRLQIIPPWFAFLLAAITAVVSFMASRRRGTITSSKHSVVGSDANPGESPIDKPTMVEKETV
jgi:hypothetical protein